MEDFTQRVQYSGKFLTISKHDYVNIYIVFYY